ncbi:MAG: hypothetical protein Q8O40_15155 [Chloroflexota bacterium]|nr:hypothetical protein [Chloroflexota bacterium]
MRTVVGWNPHTSRRQKVETVVCCVGTWAMVAFWWWLFATFGRG